MIQKCEANSRQRQPQGTSSLSNMSDAQLEAEISRLHGEPGEDALNDLGGRGPLHSDFPLMEGPINAYGHNEPFLQSGLGRDISKNPIQSGSQPGLYPLEELGSDGSHRLPYEGQGVGLQQQFGGIGAMLPGASLPSQMGLPQVLSAQDRALDDLKLRREALEKAFG